MSYTFTQIPQERDWKKAYLTAMTTRHDQHFYQNMAEAMELAGVRQQELVDALNLKRAGSPQFHAIMDELEAISDALYLLKAYYESQLDPFAQQAS